MRKPLSRINNAKIVYMAYVISIAYLLLIISTFLIILTEDTNSGKTISWLLILMFFPLVGLILYYIFGYNPRRNGKSRENYLKYRAKFLELGSGQLIQRLEDASRNNQVLPRYNKLIDLFSNSNDSAVFSNSEVEIITSGQRKLNALIEDIRKAKHHIHFEYFYFRKDQNCRNIRELLMQKAREGVKVRFIYENIANIDINPRYYTEMRESGVEVLAFTKTGLPWIRRQLNYRDHRKIVVIDGRIGYTGGMNIGDDYFVKWRDTHLRIEGMGTYGLQYNFLHAWYESGGKLPEDIDSCFPETNIKTDTLMQIVPDAPDAVWPFLLLGNVWAVQNAREYIYIQTPYYMPPDSLLQALKSAALSKVDVRIMLSSKADIFFMDPVTRSFYEETLRAGVRIYEMQDIFNHAKTFVSDDYISIIGSANMDYRSLELSFEINTYLYGEEIAMQNKEIFFNDLKRCREITLAEWLKRPWYKKIIQSFMRLLSPLL